MMAGRNFRNPPVLCPSNESNVEITQIITYKLQKNSFGFHFINIKSLNMKKYFFKSSFALLLSSLLLIACGDEDSGLLDQDIIPDAGKGEIGQFETEVFSNLTPATVSALETPYEGDLATLAGGRVQASEVSFADLAAELEKIFPGATILDFELEEERGLMVWDIEVKMPGGGVLEAVIIPEILEILELEGQSGPFNYTIDPGGEFISLAAAIEIALSVQHGEIERWELELEEDDQWEYEIHVTDGEGDWEMEINAFTGDFLEQNEKDEEDEDEFETPGEPAPQEVIDLVSNYVSGEIVKSEGDDDEDSDESHWKVHVKTEGGAIVEIKIDQATNSLLEAEDDKGPFDYQFTPGNDLLPLTVIMEIALSEFRGEIVEWELESEDNEDDPKAAAMWIYELEIEFEGGEEVEIEIDALTGEFL